jgi:hypothetical protein
MISRRTNYRVEVFPQTTVFGMKLSHVNEAKECDRILEEIKRHVDCGTVVVSFDKEYICEHCGSPWTEESKTFNGGCCDKDMENNT